MNDHVIGFKFHWSTSNLVYDPGRPFQVFCSKQTNITGRRQHMSTDSGP